MKRAPTRMLVLVSLVTLSMHPLRVRAAEGDLDSSFGENGVAVTEFPGGGSRANAVAQQLDGKLVVAGTVTAGARTDIALARYDEDGSLDEGFGNGGRVVTALASNSAARAVAVQPDGKIVVAGGVIVGEASDFALLRFTVDGAIDGAFGDGGRVTTAIGTSIDEVAAIAIQPDGKIVLAGEAIIAGKFDFAMARYDTDGELDPEFGVGGKMTTDMGAASESILSLTLLEDGKFLAFGSGSLSALSDFALARFHADGTLDEEFGTGGRVRTNMFAGTDFGDGMVVLSDGSIVVSGTVTRAGVVGIGLARYDASGVLDAEFGDGGKVFAADGATDWFVNGLVRQPDDKVVVAGIASRAGGYDFVLARYDTAGDPDPEFGTGGFVFTDLGGSVDLANAILIQPDGRLVAAGWTNAGGRDNFALARYEGTPPPVDPPTAVALDIAPGKCPNSFKTPARGKLKVAIAGTAEIDVEQIDRATIRLEGVAPLSVKVKDVATPFEPFLGREDCTECTTATKDGRRDLFMKFDAVALAAALGTLTPGECRVVHVTGRFLDGRELEGQETLQVQ